MNILITRRALLGLSALLLLTNAFAQEPRLIREAGLGVEFSAPEGWQYQKNEVGYLMGNNTIPGLIIVTSSLYTTLAEMKQGAYEGIQDEAGTALRLDGEIVTFSNNGIAGNFVGTLNWEQAKAYIIGIVNPTGGNGVSCMIITTPEYYNATYKSTIEQVAASVKFFKAEVPDAVKEWDDWFKTPGGCRLKYLTSSGGSDYGGGYSGGSSEETIDLCPNGSFGFSSSSSYSSSFDAGSAYAADSDGGQGNWTLKFNGTNPVLVLNFNDGSINEYELTYEDSKTRLNGSRYFVLFNDEGPGCY